MPLFNKPEISKSSELVFGSAKHPLNYGLGLKVGWGEVIPEINFFLGHYPIKNRKGLRPRRKR